MVDSTFANVQSESEDPIFSLSARYIADTNPNKVNLAVGVYYDANGIIPVLESVQKARATIQTKPAAPGYLPIEGLADLRSQSVSLVLGPNSPVLQNGCTASFQTLGGTGALSLGAKLLRSACPDATVYVSNPTWPNHNFIFQEEGFPLKTYDYLNPNNQRVDFDKLFDCFSKAPHGSVVCLHASCHNPTGADLDSQQWSELLKLFGSRNLIAFFDLAYQGFGDSLDADAYGPRLFATAELPCLIASSFSKSFSLYNERIGALTIVTSSVSESTKILSRVKRIIRSRYSTPPASGATVVAEILHSQSLRSLWEQELTNARTRIQSMREMFIKLLAEKRLSADLSFIAKQKGMFSLTGFKQELIDWLRAERAVYLVDGGRICFAALNPTNIEYVCTSIAEGAQVIR